MARVVFGAIRITLDWLGIMSCLQLASGMDKMHALLQYFQN